MSKDIGTPIRQSIVVLFLPCLVAVWGFHPYNLKCDILQCMYLIVAKVIHSSNCFVVHVITYVIMHSCSALMTCLWDIEMFTVPLSTYSAPVGDHMSCSEYYS